MEKEFLQLLQRVVRFTPDDWEEARGAFSYRAYSAEEEIFAAEDEPQEVIFLIEGVGRYYYIDRDGKERNKSLVKPGGAFASISTLVTGQSSPFFTQAITDCHTASIKYQELISLSENNQNWALFVRRVYEFLALKKERREASFLLLSARERYEEFLLEFAGYENDIPLRQVAMYLGITDVSLSRIRKEMGLI